MTGAGLGTIDARYLVSIEDPKIGHWFGAHMTLCHPKATPLPLGVPWYAKMHSLQLLEDYANRLSPDSFFLNKPVFIYANWTFTHQDRAHLLDYFSSMPRCVVSKNISFASYLKHLASSRFVISPRGLNIDCFRTWEALYTGSIPVVESLGLDAVYEDLPIIVVTDLSKITEPQLEEEWEKLKGRAFKLEKLKCDYWFNQILECQALLKGTKR